MCIKLEFTFCSWEVKRVNGYCDCLLGNLSLLLYNYHQILYYCICFRDSVGAPLKPQDYSCGVLYVCACVCLKVELNNWESTKIFRCGTKQLTEFYVWCVFGCGIQRILYMWRVELKQLNYFYVWCVFGCGTNNRQNKFNKVLARELV